MAKVLYNEEVFANNPGKYVNKPFAEKRNGGKITGWGTLNVNFSGEGPAKEVLFGRVFEDDTWDDGAHLRTSLLVSIDEEAGVAETLNTVYTLVQKD